MGRNRPISELVVPSCIDIRGIFEGEFLQMTQTPVTVEELENTGESLIEAIQKRLNQRGETIPIIFQSQKANMKKPYKL